ncbi:hypothetical protein D3981_004341 [Escherichia coli]|nr:hypothetical protein [Escherichia coli]
MPESLRLIPWIVGVWLFAVLLIALFRPEWLYVPGANPISQRIRAKRRAKYAEKYK